jgi:3-hydroxybutyryl-CoA dehydrogenase
MTNVRFVILGAGVMGQGLAEAIAQSGYDLYLVDRTAERAQHGHLQIGLALDREIERWGLTKSEKKATLARIHPTDELNVVRDAEIIFEAVPEEIKAKREILSRIDYLCKPDAVIVTNTATLSITELASSMTHPGRLIGMHFLNPVARVPLVEIIKGMKTDRATFNKAVATADMLGKKWITVNESPGYVTTRVVVPMINEAINVLMEGVASAEDIDEAMKLGFGFNTGPLTLADMTGLDIILAWMNNLHNERFSPIYAPSPLLRKMVRAGQLGAKTGKGFFDYDRDGNKVKKDESYQEQQMAEWGQV